MIDTNSSIFETVLFLLPILVMDVKKKLIESFCFGEGSCFEDLF
jgi:hypothetical protein